MCREEDIIDSTLGQAIVWYYQRQDCSKQMDKRQCSRHQLVPWRTLQTPDFMSTSHMWAVQRQYFFLAFITPQKGQNWLSIECACIHVQPCSTLCNSMDCSLRGSSVREIFQERILEWTLLQGILPSQESNSCLLHPLHWQAGFFFVVCLFVCFFTTDPPGNPSTENANI